MTYSQYDKSKSAEENFENLLTAQEHPGNVCWDFRKNCPENDLKKLDWSRLIEVAVLDTRTDAVNLDSIFKILKGIITANQIVDGLIQAISDSPPHLPLARNPILLAEFLCQQDLAERACESLTTIYANALPNNGFTQDYLARTLDRIRYRFPNEVTSEFVIELKGGVTL